MPVLICGSIAYDTIMVFHGEFKTHILPDQIHILNVAFVVPDMRREFGGTAGNIAYNLKLLGGDPLIMATVGDDFGPYRERLDQLGIARTHVREISGAFVPQAFITTDLNANQITAFHPGAMASSYLNKVGDAKGIKLGILAPDSRDGMLQHAVQFHDLKIPFIFDPGQAMGVFNGDELRHFVELADYVAVNDYEARILEERTGDSIEKMAGRVKAFFVTKGVISLHFMTAMFIYQVWQLLVSGEPEFKCVHHKGSFRNTLSQLFSCSKLYQLKYVFYI